MAYYVVPEFEGKVEGDRLILRLRVNLSILSRMVKMQFVLGHKSLHIDTSLNWMLLLQQKFK